MAISPGIIMTGDRVVRANGSFYGGCIDGRDHHDDGGGVAEPQSACPKSRYSLQIRSLHSRGGTLVVIQLTTTKTKSCKTDSVRP